MEDTALASELERLQAMARELEARVDNHDAPAAARELCGALAASVERAVRLAGNGNAGPGNGKNSGQPRNSRKATVARVQKQVRVASVQDTGPLDDGHSWRKYGQKDILGATYPRAYFRCTHRHSRGCQATKQVQRAAGDPVLFDVVYHGDHTCAQGDAPSLLTSPAEQLQPPASGGQEQQGSPVLAPEGIHWWPVEPVTHFSFPSSPVDAIDGSYLLASSSYGYAGTEGLGVDMEYEPLLDELFFNTSELFLS